MNKYQKVATVLAKQESIVNCDECKFKIYKNYFMSKFRNQNWKYPNIIKFKSDYIEWRGTWKTIGKTSKYIGID